MARQVISWGTSFVTFVVWVIVLLEAMTCRIVFLNEASKMSVKCCIENSSKDDRLLELTSS